MRSLSTTPQRHFCQGMTLVEVLVAAVVIGIGLMGVAALQVAALQGSSNAQSRSKATDMISSLADRVRANPDGVNDYISAAPGGNCAATAPAATCAMHPDDSTATGVSACTPTELAVYDLWEIRCDLENELPGGQLAVGCPGTCPPLTPMQITITWQVQDTTAGFTTQNVTLNMMPWVSAGPPL
ncbi:MAG: type IV pilus modification protein PilV [Candidatus Thiodiazotropha sp. (ex Ustalcina ferruginea)]|nr:type IV pilus modification protein PilV [Candidatus Thiodiazotropha sp. (ex Ustalcina ferruginea)]